MKLLMSLFCCLVMTCTAVADTLKANQVICKDEFYFSAMSDAIRLNDRSMMERLIQMGECNLSKEITGVQVLERKRDRLRIRIPVNETTIDVWTFENAIRP